MRGLTELTVILDYYIQLHKCLVANSVKEASEKIKPIAAELRKLALWEKEGKIKTVDDDADVNELGFQHIELIDDSIGPEIRRMQLVDFYEVNIDDFRPYLYPEYEPDYKPAKNKTKRNRGGN